MTALVLLPGALQVQGALAPLADALGPHVTAVTLDLPGHGGQVIPHALEPQDIVGAILAELDRRELARVHLMGYSLGGYVALLLAHAHPDRIASVCAHATKLAWTPDVAAREGRGLNPDRVQEKVPAFAAHLQRVHAPQPWPDLMRRVAGMLTQLGERPLVTPALLGELRMPALFSVGDQDHLVTTEETLGAARTAPRGQAVVLPGAAHPLTEAAQAQLAPELLAFLHAGNRPGP